MYIDFCNIKRAVKYKTIKGCETENDYFSKTPQHLFINFAETFDIQLLFLADGNDKKRRMCQNRHIPLKKAESQKSYSTLTY